MARTRGGRGTLTDIWVCATCHSLNRERATKCYKCGSPREAAAAGFETYREEQAIAARSRVAYRRSIGLCVLAAFLILAYLAATILAFDAGLRVFRFLVGEIDQIAAGGAIDRAELTRLANQAAPIAVARVGLGLAALVGFATWLARVVSNVPALGGGVMGTTPYRAFLWALIPVVNLIRIPSILQDALYRLDPRAGGFFAVLLAWFGIVGSFLIGTVAGWYFNLRLTVAASSAASVGAFVDEVEAVAGIAVAVEAATTVMAILGTIVLIVVMFRVERRAAARDREIRAAAGV